MNFNTFKKGVVLGVAVLAIFALSVPAVMAQCPMGSVPPFMGSDDCIIDPASINQFELPLVIPPVMNNNGTADTYDIAVRQFMQQILPGGLWNLLGLTTQTFPATTVWSYGPDADTTPAVAPDPTSQFNYPAYTVETKSNVPVSVRWINDLVDPSGDCLPHLLPIDQTLHWANPPGPIDSHGTDPTSYTGPVPLVTHVHGAHVDGHSDGYPEAWWLPACNQAGSYFTSGTLFDDSTGMNDGTLGYADYMYRQDQPATTLWYHDHALGMTRNNVYAGPAGFWLVRGGRNDRVDDNSTSRRWDGKLPGPAPKPGQSVLELNLPTSNIRQKIREIPIVIQDRSFKPDGSLFYPANRAYFEGVPPDELQIPFVPDPDSDIAPIWNPEAFFHVMVVNGVSWPVLEVAQARYRIRFLNGCNSRFLWLKFDNANVDVWQIGAEQGFLSPPVHLNPLNLDGGADDGKAQILMGLAERADVIVDFTTGFSNGDVITLLNIGPDEPFGGGIPGTDFDPADPTTTGRVMQFKVNTALNGKGMTDPRLPNGRRNPQAATDPMDLVLNAEGNLTPPAGIPRQLSLNEEFSEQILVCADDEENFAIPIVPVENAGDCPAEFPNLIEFGPKAALLGTAACLDTNTPLPTLVACNNPTADTAVLTPKKWTDTGTAKQVLDALGNPLAVVNVTEDIALNATEDWEIINDTADAHPIHLHLVRFEVVGRYLVGGMPGDNPLQLWESGFKDTVIAYPGEVTRIRAKFDIAGLYVWHCHIVEHEDNEMMRPYTVGLGAPIP